MQNPLLMKFQPGRFLLSLALLVVLPLLALALAGCKTATDYQDVMNPPSAITKLANLPPLAIGDTVTVSLVGPPDPILPLVKPIDDDGTITLPDIGRVPAAGKTPGQLEDYIHHLYVPSLYRHLTVTVVASSDRVYFVRGEVKNPGRSLYTGPITVTKAITAAGDFTDFANHKKVFLTRSNGQRFKLNCDKILNGDAPDPPVYPNDQIEVMRRHF